MGPLRALLALPSCTSVFLASTVVCSALLGYLRRKAAPRRAFPPLAGPHHVLAAFADVNMNSFGACGKLRVQLLAPCFTDLISDEPQRMEYYRASALKALPFAFIPADQTGWRANAWHIAAWLFYGVLRLVIGWQRHPDSVGRLDLVSAVNPEKKLPTVIFSHGLFGNMHMYTQLCRELASYGCVVLAVEHQDGTATGTTDLPYIRPHNGVNYKDRGTVRSFRTTFFERRQDELTALLRYLQETPSADMPSILRAADPSRVILVGHSFGAAGIVRSLRSSAMLRDCTKLAVLYDTWAWPLSDEDVVPDDIAAVCILSEQFRQGKELRAIAHTLGKRSSLWWLPGTLHQLWSDFAWLLPHRINPSVGNRDPRSPHAAMVATTFAALDEALGKSTPPPSYSSSAIVRLQLPLTGEALEKATTRGGA